MVPVPPGFPFSPDSLGGPANDSQFPDLPDFSTAELQTRLAFLDLNSADTERLRAMLPLYERHADAFVEKFYEHLFQFDFTARLFHDEELVARLKKSQKEHLRSLLEANWTQEFVSQRRRVGDAHAHVGIEPHIFLGAYSQYVDFFLRQLAAQEIPISSECVENVATLFRAVFLDVGLSLEAYFAELTRKLRRALDMVWRANSQLRQFAQLTSHDLKTPLATVTNLCEEVLDEFGSEIPVEAKKLIEAAKSRAFRMSQTIDELLTSTLSTRPADEDEDFSSETIISEAIDRVRPMLDEKGILLKIARPLPYVRGDRVQIREAFYNLLSNAAKFIEVKPGRIDISVELHEERCVFCVADNGPGIPSEELDRIFAPFRRLSMHRDKPGSGLGLYFTKNLIEQQRGRVWVESKLGQGAKFFVELSRTPPPNDKQSDKQ